MRIQVLFNGTPVVVPCGDGKILVRELIEKAVQRYKKLPNKSDLEIEVKSIRLKDSEAYVDQDDEVAEALQDNEMVILEISVKGENETPPPPPPSSTGPQPITSTLSSDSVPPGIPPYPPGFGPSPSQEELRDDRDPHNRSMAMTSSQDDLLDPWHTPRATSSPPPPLSRDWHSGTLIRDPALSSQDSTLALTLSRSQDDHTSIQDDHTSINTLRPDDSFNRLHDSYSQEDRLMPTSHSQPDFSYHMDSHSPQDTLKHGGGKRDELASSGSQIAVEDFHVSVSPKSYRRSFSGASPGASSLLHPKESRSPPRIKRRGSQDIKGSDSFHGRQDPAWGRGGQQPQQQPQGGVRSERSSVSSNDTSEHLPQQHRDYLEEAMAKRGQDWTHPSMMSNAWRPYPPEYLSSSLPYQPSDRYPMDPRLLSLQHKDSLRGRYPGYAPRPHPRGGQYPGGEEQPHTLMRSRSHDRALDEEPRFVQPGHYPGPYHRPQMFEEGPPVDYYLSQPTASYERPPPHPFHHNPMMGYDMKVVMGGPSGYTLSQPIPMGMYSGGGGGGGGGSRGSSFGSVDRKGRPHYGDRRNTQNENELDPCEEEDEEERGVGSRVRSSSPFKRDYRTKSIYGDGLVFGKWMERLDNYDMDDSGNELPQFEGDASQRSPSPGLSDHDADTNAAQTERGVDTTGPAEGEGEGEGGGEGDLGNVKIIELSRDEEELVGIQLVCYTSPDRKDLGVFVGGLEAGGVAARSGELSLSDRILACNGADFTNMPNKKVEQILMDMLVTDTRLKMAISRGLPQVVDEPHPLSQQQEAPQEVETPVGQPQTEPIVVNAAPGPTNVLSNTRKIGAKHTIHLVKGESGLGFGITSRDVSTNNQNPIYVKSINAGSPAAKDGHLRIGDRLLEVNGTEVTGMAHSEVLQLLRSVSGTVELVISRQEAVEEGLEEEEGEVATPSDPSHPTTATTTAVGSKTLINLEIPLSNSEAAGLGITVHGKSRAGGNSGIYVKTVFPGAAAAKDGRLQRNDQIVCIGTVNVLGKLDHEALETLKKALAAASTQENAKLRLVVARTVGINRKPNLSMGSFSSQMAALGEVSEEEDDHDRGDRHAPTEVGIDVPQEVGAGNSQHNSPFDDHVIHQELDLSRNSASEDEPSRGSVRIRAEHRAEHRAEPSASDSMVRRLKAATLPMSQESSQRATLTENDCLELSDSYGHGSSQPIEYSSLSLSLPDHDDMTSLDRRSTARPYNGFSNVSSVGQATPSAPPTTTTSLQARTRQASVTEERVTNTVTTNGSTDILNGAPIRGSNRRNKPERGSGRHPHQSPTHSLNESSVGVYATLPRHSSSSHPTSHSPRSTTPTNPDTESLCSGDYGSDTDAPNGASLLSRHNRWRISITKKTKKDYLKDLQQYRVQNAEPEIEGAAGMMRTGSDGCLSNNIDNSADVRLMDGVELGPSLGMAKSSSLESLHNVYKNAIKLDNDDGDKDSRKLRARGASFSVSSPTAGMSDGKSSPALVSYKKSPSAKVKNSKESKGIFNFFRRKKDKKADKGKKTKPRSISMPVSRSSALLEEVHPMIGQDGSSPHEAYLSQQGKDHSASPQHLPNTMGNENSDDEEDDDDSMAISSMARV